MTRYTVNETPQNTPTDISLRMCGDSVELIARKGDVCQIIGKFLPNGTLLLKGMHKSSAEFLGLKVASSGQIEIE